MKRTSSKPDGDREQADRLSKRPAPPPPADQPVPDPYLDAKTEKMPAPPRRKT